MFSLVPPVLGLGLQKKRRAVGVGRDRALLGILVMGRPRIAKGISGGMHGSTAALVVVPEPAAPAEPPIKVQEAAEVSGNRGRSSGP